MDETTPDLTTPGVSEEKLNNGRLVEDSSPSDSDLSLEGTKRMEGGSAWSNKFLQVFMQSFRNGELSPSGKLVSAHHAEDVTRSVGQTMAELGAGDYHTTRIQGLGA
jgi:hypothetical protein